jgi:AraC-like DNA-binding protein
MFYRSCRPRPPLSDFIDYLWLLSDAPAHARESVLPSGTMELVVNLRDDEFQIYHPAAPELSMRHPGAMVSGTYARSFVINTAQHASIMGVHFKVGGAFPFLGFPASELADRHVDLEALWGGSARELRERLCAVATPVDRFHQMEASLRAHMAHSVRRHDAVRTALARFAHNPGASVRDTARDIGISHRRLIQVFAGEVGLTPKQYCRVRRFRSAIYIVHDIDTPNWAGLAADCGYFDQSHFIHDFRSFSGLNPSEYLRQRSARVKEHHVPLAQ